MIFIAVLLAFVACVRGLSGPVLSEKIPVSRIPAADRLFHVYALPIGQGSANVIQCPSGAISIFDMGTRSSSAQGFWTATEIKDFLQDGFLNVTNIFLTHNDEDHYSLLSEVFSDPTKMTRLQFIYISGLFADMDDSIKIWVNNINATDKVTTFNGGDYCCSRSDPPCSPVVLCPGDSAIATQVLSVNAGLLCSPISNNADSIVIGITYKSFKLQLNGDFEDCTTTATELNGPQQLLVNYYGPELEVTVYMLAHHGAQSKANKEVIRNAVRPRAVFASADPWYSTNCRHPRCDIIDAFIIDVQSLCKPGETNTSSQFYCGEHPRPTADKLQSTYTCGANDDIYIYEEEKNNVDAIYSTTPDYNHYNLIHLLTDGAKWGFVNHIFDNYERQTTSESVDSEADECSEEN